MFKVLFLLVFFMSLPVSGQTPEKKEAYKFFEYEKINDKFLAEKAQSFCAEINKTDWVGFIVNYGSTEEIEKREKRILKSFENYECHKEFPSPRITFVSGGDKKTITEFWIAPPGEEPPIQ